MPSTDHAIQPSQTTPSLLTRVGRAFRYAIKRFPLGLWRYPWIVAFLIVYAVARVLLNRSMGASWANALRPLALSLLTPSSSLIALSSPQTLESRLNAQQPASSRWGCRYRRWADAGQSRHSLPAPTGWDSRGLRAREQASLATLSAWHPCQCSPQHSGRRMQWRMGLTLHRWWIAAIVGIDDSTAASVTACSDGVVLLYPDRELYRGWLRDR